MWGHALIKLGVLFSLVLAATHIKPDHVTPTDNSKIALFGNVTYENLATFFIFRIDSTWEIRTSDNNETLARGRWTMYHQHKIGLDNGCVMEVIPEHGNAGEVVHDKDQCFLKSGYWMEMSPKLKVGINPSMWNDGLDKPK